MIWNTYKIDNKASILTVPKRYPQMTQIASSGISRKATSSHFILDFSERRQSTHLLVVISLLGLAPPPAGLAALGGLLGRPPARGSPLRGPPFGRPALGRPPAAPC